MTHTYQLTGMTCGGCEAKVKSTLLMLPDVTSVELSRETNTATITMDKHVALSEMQKALGGAEGKYQISALAEHNEVAEQARSWFETYKPILLIFGYLLLATLLVQFGNPRFDFTQWMRHFMAGFFLTFSFFKFLNLKGFAESYAMYDVVARRVPAWGYGYAFTELALGVVFLTDFRPVLTNAVALVVMSVSIVGVLQSVLNKRKNPVRLPRRGLQFADEHGDDYRRCFDDSDERGLAPVDALKRCESCNNPPGLCKNQRGQYNDALSVKVLSP